MTISKLLEDREDELTDIIDFAIPIKSSDCVLVRQKKGWLRDKLKSKILSFIENNGKERTIQ